MSYLKSTGFWNKLNHSVQLFGTGSQVALVASESSHVWNYIAAGATTATMLVAIWMEDRNSNGIVDVFEDCIKDNDTRSHEIHVQKKRRDSAR